MTNKESGKKYLAHVYTCASAPACAVSFFGNVRFANLHSNSVNARSISKSAAARCACRVRRVASQACSIRNSSKWEELREEGEVEGKEETGSGGGVLVGRVFHNSSVLENQMKRR